MVYHKHYSFLKINRFQHKLISIGTHLGHKGLKIWSLLTMMNYSSLVDIDCFSPPLA